MCESPVIYTPKHMKDTRHSDAGQKVTFNGSTLSLSTSAANNNIILIIKNIDYNINMWNLVKQCHGNN